MRAKSLILFVIAVGCGLAASIGVSQYMEQAKNNKTMAETTPILVAISAIGIGEKLEPENVKLEEWPKDRLPEGAIYELKGVEGKFSRTRLYAGEPILEAKLMDTAKGNSTTIPKGMRVVSVKVSVDTAVSGLLQPGDRVDVLVMLRKSPPEIPESGTRTILRDVNVFSVDGTTERDVDEKGQARALSTVSLLLKPQQAEAVMLACELGRLSLTLRAPGDETEAVTEGLTVSSLLGNASESANEKKTSSGLTGWLNGLTNQVPPQPTPTVAMPANTTPEKPEWTMKILGPTGYQEFYWTDEKELPTERVYGVTNNAPGGLTAPAATVPVSTATTEAAATPADSEDSEAPAAAERTTSARSKNKEQTQRESPELVEEVAEGDESPE